MNSLAAIVLVGLATVCSGSFLSGQQCEYLLDVVVVLDGSETISQDEFQTIREVMAKFVPDLGVEDGGKHLGVVVYSSEVAQSVSLSGDRDGLIEIMKTLTHPRTGTRTDLGIEEMIEVFNRSGRPGIPKVGIVVTDGASHEKDRTIEQAQRAKEMGVNMFSVGIGARIIEDELKDIASSEDQAFFIDDVAGFADLVNGLEKEICPTTTRAPTTATSPPPTKSPPTKPPTKGPCDGCRMRNGIGYSSHKDCDKFYQCSFNGERLITYWVQRCAAGTFWDQDLLTCNYIGKVNCRNDRCRKEQGLVSYKDRNGGCANYIECVKRRSQAAKCRRGYAYSEEDGLCLVDDSCTGGGNEEKLECNFFRVPGNSCSYFWRSGTQIWKMPCPRGTRFAQRKCGCVYGRPNRCRKPACKPLVDIDFNSAEPGEYDNYGAVVNGGLAYFDGNSNIKILTLANVEFTTKLSIYIRFKPEISRYANETKSGAKAVVTNGDCGYDSTISLTNNGELSTFSIIDKSDTEWSVRDVSSELWREAVYTVRKGFIGSDVNGRADEKSASGNEMPKRSQCAFQLGHGTGFRDFKGWIDYIVVSTC